MRRTATQEILSELLPDRRRRSNPRVIKRKISGFPVKRSHHRHWPQPTRTPRDAITVRLPQAA